MRPYHYVNMIGGSKSSVVMEEADKITAVVKKAKRPLFVLGSWALKIRLGKRLLLEYGLDIAKACQASIVATADTKRELLALGVVPDSTYDIIEIINHLQDPDWKGIKGEGNHDLVLFMGVRSDIADRGLATLKHFASHLKTLALCKFYHPNATFTLPNLKDDKWQGLLETLIEDLRKEFGVKEEIREEVRPKEVKFSVDIGPQYEGERIRKEDFYLDFGGGANRFKGELLKIRPLDEIEDGRVTIIGKDIKDFAEGSSSPLFIKIYVGGEIEEEMEPVFERRLHLYLNYIEGFWHMGSRSENWMRLHKKSFQKGLNSFDEIGRILIMLFKNELPIIERMEVTFVTDPQKVEEEASEAKEVYNARDERLKGIRDEEVEEFYGCTLCQSFAPTHVCVVTPERPGLCGSVSWFDARAAYKIDPKGAQFSVPKGDLIDPEKFIYSGVNEVVTKKSLGGCSVFAIHSILENPPSSCGCFQAIVFYIPEVDGFGIVHRDFVGETVGGVRFSTMAGQVSGGRQVEGYVGVALLYISSPKFLISDGGLKRVVWMPKVLKEKMKDTLEAAGLIDKIATEDETKNIDELTAFLEKVQHPWLYGG